jgi:PAP2 superfamily
MMPRFSILNVLVAVSCTVAGGMIFVRGHARGPSPEPSTESAHGSRDEVLHWNAILLQACANDYDTSEVPTPDQKGPGKTARAFAIVHAAIFDTVNSFDGSFTPYLTSINVKHGSSRKAAVAQAAHDTLVAAYPQQQSSFDKALQLAIHGIPPDSAKKGIEVGRAAASNILAARANDGSQLDQTYQPTNLPGYHQPDPLHPDQGYLGMLWGSVTPFALTSSVQFPVSDSVGVDPQSRLAWLNSAAYTAAYNEVQALGSKNSNTRTADQTEIGIFWSYDGSPQLGTPPRLYNQIARQIAHLQGNSEAENARLFALINLAMADAGISAWEAKYTYQFWRPIVGIRGAASTGNFATVADPSWEPLGAQADNNSGTNFTPSFPSYVSGHATFGSALFQVLRSFYGKDDIDFRFQSDEFNGVTRDETGAVRPCRTREYANLTEAELENHDSRIFLGVHWRFDQDQGLNLGRAIGDFVFNNFLLPR